MKKLFTLLFPTFVLLGVSQHASAAVGEYFNDDLFRYRIINENPYEVSLSDVNDTDTEFSGILEIPGTVKNEGIEFRVVEIDQYVFYNRAQRITQIKFPDTILIIGGGNFNSCTELQSINLPPNLKQIGIDDFVPTGSFSNCTNLTKLTLPNTLTYIGGSSFSGCTSLTEINFSDSLEYIGYYSFAMCTGLTQLEFPSSLSTICSAAFKDCENLKEVTIRSSELEIKDPMENGGVPFTNCSIETLRFECNEILTSYSFLNFENLELGDKITKIGNDAFAGCAALKNLVIPDSVEAIGDNAFSDCIGIDKLEIPASLSNIGQSAFSNTSISELTLPETLAHVGEKAFFGCPIKKMTINTSADINGVFSVEDLTEVAFGKETNSIPSFSGASKLISVTLPSALTIVPDNAFTNCISLSSLDLPTGIKEIGNFAFDGCISLKDIKLSENVTSIGAGAFRDCKLFSSFQIPPRLTSIKDFSFNGCSGITSISIPDAIQQIGDYAFSGCSLNALEIPGNVVTIGEKAFENNNLSFLIIPKNLENVGMEAFYGNPLEKVYVLTEAPMSGVFPYENLVEVIFGENAVTIPIFIGAQKLKDVTLPPLMTYLPDMAFSNCKSLQNVNFNDNLKSIGLSAFAGCSNLKELSLPSELSSIGFSAFSDCSSLEVFRMPANVSEIPMFLFANCTSLEKVYLPESISSIGEYAFQNCASLRSLIIPEGVVTIPAYMMQNCKSLNEILIPNTVTSISERAFANCTSLRNIDLGTKLYEIANYAFEGCDNIKDIHSMALNPPYAEMYTFPIQAYENATITVQEQSLTRYNEQNPWYRFMNYLTVDGAISLSHYKVDMAGNEVFQLGVYGANSDIVWTTTNPSVAYANECGLIVAMGITGSTVITANVDGEKINCNVIVSAQKREVKGVKKDADEVENVEPVDIIIESIGGNPPMVNARLIPIGSCTVVDWTTSNSDIATVENGIVTVLNEGDVEFGVETENGLEENLEVNTEDIEEAGILEIIDDMILENSNVYDFTGRCLIIDASEEQIKQLDKGLYIVNGKKVLVK